MTNQCHNCGGNLRYDISASQLKCDSCDSLFPVDTFQSETGAEDHAKNELEVTKYSCPNCGAELSSTENAALDYCLYCGSFVTLNQQMSRIRKPDNIIPFSKSKKECITAYRKMIARKIYAPKEFRKEEFLDTFRGIYIPYWEYNYECGPDIRLNGEEEDHREGDYIYMQKYKIDCQGSIHVGGINYDASSTFDDSISNQISEFDEEKKKPFHPGYMFGFYGDTADVESDLYCEDADGLVDETLWDVLANEEKLKEGHLVKPSEEKKNKDSDDQEGEKSDKKNKTQEEQTLIDSMNLRRSPKLTMIPVWFLTWRKDKQVAYSVVNGDTGDIYSEVPVDVKRYLIFSLLTAVPIFFLLNNMITFNCSSLLLLAMFLSCFFQVIYSTEIERIVKRTLHIGDKGYLSRHKEEKEKNEKQYKDNFLVSVFQFVYEILFEDGILGFFIAAIAAFLLVDFVVIGAVIILVVAPFYSTYRIWKNSRILHEPGIIVDFVITVAALLCSLIIFLLDPAGDYFYYGAALICLLTVAFATVRMLIRYNEVITRPVPHFFESEEGGME